MGFGNAGVHLPHACAYPIAGRVHGYRPPDYPQAKAMAPRDFMPEDLAAIFRNSIDNW